MELDINPPSASPPQEFAILYDQYYSRVYNYIRYRCRDAQDADDLTAQVFERLLNHLAGYRSDRGAFEPWLFTIVRNVITDHHRRNRRWQLFWQAQQRTLQPQESPEQDVIDREETRSLFNALDRLDERSRELVALKFFARLTNRQIASVSGLTESNVSVILYRALNQLRQYLGVQVQKVG